MSARLAPRQAHYGVAAPLEVFQADRVPRARREVYGRLVGGGGVDRPVINHGLAVNPEPRPVVRPCLEGVIARLRCPDEARPAHGIVVVRQPHRRHGGPEEIDAGVGLRPGRTLEVRSQKVMCRQAARLAVFVFEGRRRDDLCPRTGGDLRVGGVVPEEAIAAIGDQKRDADLAVPLLFNDGRAPVIEVAILMLPQAINRFSRSQFKRILGLVGVFRVPHG